MNEKPSGHAVYVARTGRRSDPSRITRGFGEAVYVATVEQNHKASRWWSRLDFKKRKLLFFFPCLASCVPQQVLSFTQKPPPPQPKSLIFTHFHIHPCLLHIHSPFLKNISTQIIIFSSFIRSYLCFKPSHY